MRRSLTLGTAAIAAVALLAGCGSSSSSSSSSTAASTPATTAAQSSATTTTASTSTGSGVTVEAKQSKLGTILAAGPKKLTVYLFEKDKGTTSACEGQCASAWLPVTTAGSPAAAGGAVSADLGTTKRPDGTMQVTYKGHPLYFFEEDKDSGDAYGQGSTAFGAGWYVLKPNGSKIDEDKGGGKGSDES